MPDLPSSKRLASDQNDLARPYPAYEYVFPHVAAETRTRLAYYFVAEFPGQEKVEGHAAVIRAEIQRWEKRWHRSELFWLTFGEDVVVFDYRESHDEPPLVLRDLALAVFLEAREVCPAEALCEKVRRRLGEGYCEEEFLGPVRSLVERKIVLEDEGSYLNVAVMLGPWCLPRCDGSVTALRHRFGEGGCTFEVPC
jgi:hypothetical protein